MGVKGVIKDIIFEKVLLGEDIRTVLRELHFIDGFEKKDIIEAYNEMVEEVKSTEN